jgi:hypothetical protein
MPTFPEMLFDFAFVSEMNSRLQLLSEMAEPEDWDYKYTQAGRPKPILYNYITRTYSRLSEEEKIEISANAEHAAFDTGLVTPNQERIFAFFGRNQIPDQQSWFLHNWCLPGEHLMNDFEQLPEMAHYFDDPTALVYDTRKPLRVNVEHMVADNRERFPASLAQDTAYVLQGRLNSAIEHAKERVRRNYKVAIPQYYRGKIQLLLPLCLTDPSKADLAIVVDSLVHSYRASTCLTLDMAYNNARQITRPDRDWLQP